MKTHYPDKTRVAWKQGDSVVKTICNKVVWRSETSENILKVDCKACRRKLF